MPDPEAPTEPEELPQVQVHFVYDPDSGAVLGAAGIYKTVGTTTSRTLVLDSTEQDLYSAARGDLMGLMSL